MGDTKFLKFYLSTGLGKIKLGIDVGILYKCG